VLLTERRLARAAQAGERNTAAALVLGFTEISSEFFAQISELRSRLPSKQAQQQAEFAGVVHRLPEQVGNGLAQRIGHFLQHEHRWIGLPAFKLGQITFRNLRVNREQLASHAAGRAGFAHTQAKTHQQLSVLIGLRKGRRLHGGHELYCGSVGWQAI